jgi:hypothetical protein
MLTLLYTEPYIGHFQHQKACAKGGTFVGHKRSRAVPHGEVGSGATQGTTARKATAWRLLVPCVHLIQKARDLVHQRNFLFGL